MKLSGQALNWLHIAVVLIALFPLTHIISMHIVEMRVWIVSEKETYVFPQLCGLTTNDQTPVDQSHAAFLRCNRLT